MAKLDMEAVLRKMGGFASLFCSQIIITIGASPLNYITAESKLAA